MKELEELIGPALEAVETHLSKDKKSVAKEYDGYIASFGASIRTAGLLPTLAFYSDYHKEGGGSSPRRNHVLKALYHIVKIRNKEAEKSAEDKLLKAAVESKDLKQLEKDLLEASVALKLALRNFVQND